MTLPELKPFNVHAAAAVGRTVAALGARYTIGAFRMCDSPFAELTYRFPAGLADAREQNGTFPSRWDEATRAVAFDVGLEFPVSGPAGADWRMVVTNEPDGNHAIWLTGLFNGVRETVSWLHGISAGALCNCTIQLHAAAKKRASSQFSA